MEIISDKLYKEIEKYCIINNIDDIPKEINNILQIGFNVIRFGVSPFQKTVPIPQSEGKKDDKIVLPKKRGRKPKVVEENVEQEYKEENIKAEPPKTKVRIIKNK